MTLLPSSSKNAAWIRIDRDRVDVLVGTDEYHGSCTAGMIDGIQELADWLSLRSPSHCHVMIGSHCCFICGFTLVAGSAAASDTAIRFAAEACLPMAIEEVAAVYFRDDRRVLFVAIRKSLLRQLQHLPASIRVAVPESLLITGGLGAKSKTKTAVQIQMQSVRELVTWRHVPTDWTVIESDVGHSSAMLNKVQQGLGEASVESMEWRAEQGLGLAQAAYQKLPRALLRQLNFLVDPTLSQDSPDAASASILLVSQIVFGCCLALICALLYRQANLDSLAIDFIDQRTEVIKSVFEKNSSRTSNRKVLSELRLRRGHQKTAQAWLDLKPVAVGLFAEVLEALAEQADVNVVSVESKLGSVEVVCQVQTKERTSRLVKQLSAADFAVQVLYQRPADGLLSVQLLLNSLKEGVR